ncbi:MAG: CHASE2 domain-containing protein, partial [Saprospiraceae bacterium]|nr:CHASE2 domain-containing protein [Saprospiraceae bacterium]
VAYKHPEIAEALLKRNLKKEWINFRRKQVGSANGHYPVNSDEVNHYPSVFMEDFINNASSYDDDYFVNKIVLIGFMGENEKAYSMKDRYFTPLNEKYSGRSHPDMHGVLVHANIISMIQHADYINEVSEVRLYIIAFLLFFINFLFFDRIVKKNLFFTVATIRVIQIIQFILLFSLCIYLMSVHSIKVGFVLIITAVILSFELYEFYHKRIQKKIDIVFFK